MPGRNGSTSRQHSVRSCALFDRVAYVGSCRRSRFTSRVHEDSSRTTPVGQQPYDAARKALFGSFTTSRQDNSLTDSLIASACPQRKDLGSAGVCHRSDEIGPPSSRAESFATRTIKLSPTKGDDSHPRVRRVKPTPGSQLALFVNYSYHGFITDRDGTTLELEADHRRHAEIENAIRDLKYGVGLNHLPSGRFAANAAWLAVQVMAHNLARWTARIGLGEQVVTTKTLRRRFFSLAGRLTRSARRLTLHLPQRWPWETQFSSVLARLRAIPLPA